MITEFHALRPGARLYIAAVVLAGISVIGHSIYRLGVDPIGNRWILLALLTLLTGSFNVKVPSINAYISVSEAFVFASILLFGTPAGTATVVLECMVVVFWMKPHTRLVHRVLFNMAAPSVSVWTAGTAFYLLSGIEPYSRVFTPLPQLLLPLLVFTALYFLLNSWLVAIAVGLENFRSPVDIWWNNFAWLSVNYFSGASLAALIVTYTRELRFSTLAVIVPLLVVSYLTFRAAMGRAEDSYSHLAELNRLYLSTIETLAMAIDAKDQITHGHIRRVQTYAVGLAKSVGVSDGKLLKAIEAAALLHDMGKLAVPEHILNKPGKLTPAEFEKMKLHASVGADILSAIDFPYPVVPIVRHHHENWDGTGYPDQLRGTDIPIGARILSVVDCFDALTSDRPYRPRLADAEALDILRERRGSMYDPLIVDTFVRVFKEIGPEQTSHSPAQRALSEITSSSTTLRVDPAKRDDVLPRNHPPAGQHAAPLIGRRSLTDIGDAMAERLRPLVPFSLSIVYLYDTTRDELSARYATGPASALVTDLRFSRGEGLSGWVAANRRAILNSDPALDLGEIAHSAEPNLRASLCVPLLVSRELIGVLALYTAEQSFNEEHQRITESVALHVAHSIKRQTASTEAGLDALTGLPMANQLVGAFEAHFATQSTASLLSSVLIVELWTLREINAAHGHDVGDEALLQVAALIQRELRPGEVLFRIGGDDFAVVLAKGEQGRAVSLIRSIRTRIRATPLLTRTGDSLDLSADVHSLSLPLDMDSLLESLGPRQNVHQKGSDRARAPERATA